MTFVCWQRLGSSFKRDFYHQYALYCATLKLYQASLSSFESVCLLDLGLRPLFRNLRPVRDSADLRRGSTERSLVV